MQAAPPPAQAVDSLGAHTSAPSHSPGRQYQSQQSQPTEKNHGQQSGGASASSPSSRRPGRRASGNGSSTASPNTPQQPRVDPTNGSSPSGSNVTTPRNLPLPPSSHPSPTTGTGNGSPSTFNAISDQLGPHDGPVVAPPPRTSSHQQQQVAPSEDLSTSNDASRAVADRRDRRDRATDSSTNHHGRTDRERTKDDTTSAAALAAQSRRKAQHGPRDDRSHRPASARDKQSPRTAQTQSGAAREDSALSREGSTVINRVVVTDPQVDLERESERLAEAIPSASGTDVTPVTGLGLVGDEGVDDGGRGGGRTRQDYSASASRRKETRFGEYILGQTLGEGEFGKVKMGWKKEGGVQVAIKLIRRESLGTNPTRLPKIYREISILRELSHPNIVRLHEMVETERHIGIILEYASGGELFDYILTHRYLKDQAARRLFAQLVSGVGYLHKKGIVHRDLKLENLLLDRNRNIIITDFGFANTFDPTDELGDEIEYNLTSREFVKKHDLERVRESGHRRGDLMQTSCGSPCYAAPELVVSDSLYTGRKVDVWSCGVILYAMLAGYLPFDDDPANPEGDNINLLYKYIVSTPLTFPEYVTPHARDLLRRILVADPRARADLFEVARHSWLSEYAHVVSFITSSTTTTGDISNATVSADNHRDVPLLARSASVREPSKTHQPHVAAVGGLAQKHGTVDQEAQTTQPKPQRDAKRRTVQVEYVAPQSQTARGEALSPTSNPVTSPTTPASASKSPKASSKGAVDGSATRASSTSKPLPNQPGVTSAHRHTASYQASPVQSRTRQRPASSAQDFSAPPRSRREAQRSVSDSTDAFGSGSTAKARPRTGGSMASTGGTTLPSRASYSRPGQPVAPTVAATNAQGRLAQPQGGKQYVISNPIPQSDDFLEESAFGRPSTTIRRPEETQNHRPLSFNPATARGHKRSNTVGGIGERLFGRSGSIFGGRNQAQANSADTTPQKTYPPTSMPASMASGGSRPSTDSRRSTSYGSARKDSITQEKPRRFSLLGAFSKNYNSGSGGGRAHGPPRTAQSTNDPHDFARRLDSRGRVVSHGPAFGIAQSRSTSPDTTDSATRRLDSHQGHHPANSAQPPSRRGEIRQQDHAAPYPETTEAAAAGNSGHAAYPSAPAESAMTTESESSLNAHHTRPLYPPGFNSYDGEDRRNQGRWGRGSSVLQKNNRKFVDAYEQEPERRFAAGAHSSGSSGAARKVMDFFRRRGKARVGDDR